MADTSTFSQRVRKRNVWKLITLKIRKNCISFVCEIGVKSHIACFIHSFFPSFVVFDFDP